MSNTTNLLKVCIQDGKKHKPTPKKGPLPQIKYSKSNLKTDIYSMTRRMMKNESPVPDYKYFYEHFQTKKQEDNSSSQDISVNSETSSSEYFGSHLASKEEIRYVRKQLAFGFRTIIPPRRVEPISFKNEILEIFKQKIKQKQAKKTRNLSFQGRPSECFQENRDFQET